MRDGEHVEVELIYRGETDAAYRCADADGDTVWLPKSQCEADGRLSIGSVVSFLIPEWLAEAKGLV